MPKPFTALTVGAVVALAGCTGEVSVLGGAPTADHVAASLESGVTLDTPRFNPFSDALETVTAAREVIANPGIGDIMQAGDLPEMALGRPDAPVTIVEYASLSCPYSRRLQLETFPVLKKEYIDTGKVRFILREFPIGKQSGLATIALRCAAPDKHFALYDKLMSQQAWWVSQEVRPDPIYQVAAQVGLTRSEFDSCRQDQRLIARLNWVKERGRRLGVIGTPNFFIQGRLVKSVIGMKEIREIVDPILATRGPPRPADNGSGRNDAGGRGHWGNATLSEWDGVQAAPQLNGCWQAAVMLSDWLIRAAAKATLWFNRVAPALKPAMVGTPQRSGA